MAELYGPFDSGVGSTFSEDGWAKLMRAMSRDGVIYQFATEITSPYTGQAANGLRVTSAGALDVNVAVGVANVHGLMYENTSTLTLTHDAAPVTVGQSRNDIVAIRLDRANNTAAAVIIKGTAATTPSDPALARTQATWEIPLARVNIPANAVNLGTISDYRKWAYWPPDIWTSMALGGAIITFGGGHPVPAWTVDAGRCVIRGIARTNAALAAGGSVCSVPSNFAPSYKLGFEFAGIRYDVLETGVIVSTSAVPTATNFLLDGVSWPIRA